MIRVSEFVRYAWASPATLLGLTLALLAIGSGGRARLVAGTIEIDGGSLRRLIGRLPPAVRFGAITFGHVIIGVDQHTLACVRAHEQVHVRQYERWGGLFLPLYLASSLWQFARGRDPYRDNRFEREARERSTLDAVLESRAGHAPH